MDLYTVNPGTTYVDVAYDDAHVSVLAGRVARKIAAEQSGKNFGVAVNVAEVSKSVQSQLSALATVAGGEMSYNYTLRGVLEPLWPLLREIFPARKSGRATTTVLRLKSAAQAVKPAETPAADGVKVVSEGPEKPTVLVSAENLRAVEAIGITSGISLVDGDVSTGGNFGVLSATAEWDGEDCFVYTSDNLSETQLLLVAAFNIQGSAKASYGANPDVAKLPVVLSGHVVI